ncbi:DUF5810 domain-containing protein [Halalkalicoccus jeotgali]|uniref:Uncharacterized protein n=1 Tax=Halalkalicoccus jeotgali (strain DSM 18796 / CECT 7217 / JCM 14584 / KCTC 4019 / B3) TaxID=795797 RepID=D8J7L4_HALJB|nr:DUF5810 domain-containing protein [Halalkalicoccus jeotgali]ADJ16034.1 hypothetical protein HacjB3_13265 [Halalkalicoccus jeotgali B3]ELY38130.1 hypothetical protein C497_08469 [Halalkalicoccus jeotgali B3]
MGYACPICEIPQQDEKHLANHLAFAAMLGREDHEGWLDEHVPDWEGMGPESLGERVATFAPEEEFETTFEDTTTGHGGSGRLEDAVPRQHGRQAMGGEASDVLAEAQAMTREMYESEEE